jgi:type II secretory pathway predicted ATPase ExeA
VTDRLETQLRAFFGFKQLPFRKDFTQGEYFPTTACGKTLKHLRYLVDRKGIGTLVCPPGTGKSTVLRVFMDSLARTAFTVCYVAHTTCSVLDLVRQISRGFGLEPRYRRADVFADLKTRLEKLAVQQKTQPVLVLDDAHLLSGHFLDELQVLASFEADGRDELTIVLAGQPQLRANLALAVNESFSQRVVLRLELEPWTRDEVASYLDYRLQRAGRTAKLFKADALSAVVKASRGIPRLVDRVAEHALILALEAGSKTVDVELVTAALEQVEP